MKQDETGTIWYSESYMDEMIRRAEYRGFINGAKIEFHCVTPKEYSNYTVNRAIEDFKNKIKSNLL